MDRFDRRLWSRIVQLTRSIDRGLPTPRGGQRYPDRLILRMALWAVWKDRPMCWACERAHYDGRLRMGPLPSVSQFSRRLRSRRFDVLLRRLHRRLARDDHEAMAVGYLDGKPLPVGDATKDPDATTGRGCGRFSRGYKLHALVDALGKICDYRVRPLNEQEQPVAWKLISSVPPHTLLIADGNYDSGTLYERARARGVQLLTRLRQVPRSPEAVAQMPPGRRAAYEAWEMDPEGTAEIYALRGGVERTFAHLTSCAGGLSPLPAWVRRLDRVQRWVAAKIILHNARIDIRRALGAC